MTHAIKIIQNHPFLIPSVDFKSWNGIINIEGDFVRVSFLTPLFPSLKKFTLMCTASLERKIKLLIDNFNVKHNLQDSELSQLLEYLQAKHRGVEIDNEDRLAPDSGWLVTDYSRYKQVLSELRQLGSESVVSCGMGLCDVTLCTVDVRGIEHQLVLGLGPHYPKKPPTLINVDLPPIAVNELHQVGSIVQMFQVFQMLVDSYQDFWKTFDSIMKNTWVIDPDHPTFKDTQCRIIIGENVSIVVTLNPKDVNTCPEIKFLGPETVVTPYINSLETKLKTVGWNEDLSLLDNLLSLLGLSQFPLRELNDNMGPQQEECSICFIARLEDQALPTKVCNNTKCNSYFHITCLAQWFQAVPTNETSFNLISGDCPCCGELGSRSAYCVQRCQFNSSPLPLHRRLTGIPEQLLTEVFHF